RRDSDGVGLEVLFGRAGRYVVQGNVTAGSDGDPGAVGAELTGNGLSPVELLGQHDPGRARVPDLNLSRRSQQRQPRPVRAPAEGDRSGAGLEPQHIPGPTVPHADGPIDVSDGDPRPVRAEGGGGDRLRRVGQGEEFPAGGGVPDANDTGVTDGEDPGP